MALLNESVEFKKLDTRLVERNIARGVLSHQEYLHFVDALPDDAENAEWVSVESLSKSMDDSETSEGSVFSEE